MTFNSPEFLIFFVVVFAVHYALPPSRRWLLLLAGSYFFYMWWSPSYGILLAFSTLVDFFAALRMPGSSPTTKRVLLGVSLVSNLGLLFVFKYFNFTARLLSTIGDLTGYFRPLPIGSVLHVLLPVGISFYTFQSMSYTIDVYRGRLRPTSHLGLFALYLSFFPQLVAGPIERAGHLLPQFRHPRPFDYDRAASGLQLVLRGLLKKLLIADNLGTFVDPVFLAPEANGPATLALATLAFSFQIYCDFSGYSDIAIGTGRILGYDLMENFRRPYLAGSIPEFWRRWHISLSTWFRDYVYVSLGGNRVSPSRLRWNLFVVFALSGLWHGADWTFVVWGAFHGMLMIAWVTLERFSLPTSPWVARVLGVGITCFLVCVGWVFFRAESIGDAWYVLGQVGSFDAWSVAEIVTTVDRLRPSLRVAFAACAIMTVWHVIEELRGSAWAWAKAPRPARWLVYQSGVVALLLFGHFEEAPFIYFQF